MPHLSSPVAYPPSSSPPVIPEKRKKAVQPTSPPWGKRRHLDIGHSPIKNAPTFRDPKLTLHEPGFDSIRKPGDVTMTVKGPFLDDDDDDSNADTDEKKDSNEDETEDSSGLDVFDRAPAMGDNLADALLLSKPQVVAGLLPVTTSSGKTFRVPRNETQPQLSYEKLIASRSKTAPGKASRNFYGIDIHDLLEHAAEESNPSKSKTCLDREAPFPSVERPLPSKGTRKGRSLLWTEKYRARKFTDLVGDERTHRDVLRWIKSWDAIVFSGSSKPKLKAKFAENETDPKQHRKILMLTGPPGLGKTTLAHVCARQAGYEVVEINASDERSRDVVKGRIRDCVGTETVRGINTKEARGTTRKAGRPVCVVIDEVDGVVGGSGAGGEGGFIKALIDLAVLDQKNSNPLGATSGNVKRAKKGDRFRLLRPLILVCNDIYHPALRPLRSSTMAEIIHIRRPPLDKVVTRLKSVFDREGIPCDRDGVRRLCEATWGISNRKEARSSVAGGSEGDMRGVMVVGEWVATKMRASSDATTRLTKSWVEKHMLENLSHGGNAGRGLGRGGVKEAVDRVFLDGAGFPKTTTAASEDNFCKIRESDAVGVAELAKRTAMDRLREMVDMSGESNRIINDCFATYPTHPWQDDTLLSKPDAAYEWLHFHDRVSSKIHIGQEWELGSYLSQSVLGFHSLFASPAKQSWVSDQKRWEDEDDEEEVPFSGPRADHAASEALKQSKAILQGLQSSLSLPLHRCFKSTEDISVELLPYLVSMLTPDVKPIVVGGSGDQRGIVSVRREGEREMVLHAVNVMGAVGVTFERTRVESSTSGMSSHIYRMEPALDEMATFGTATPGSSNAPARYAIRQALDQEYRKYLLRQNADARQARYKAGSSQEDEDDQAPGGLEDHKQELDAKARPAAVKRDFFGRAIGIARPASQEGNKMGDQGPEVGKSEDRNIWVSFHEGFSNAVRKPITLDELMRGF